MEAKVPLCGSEESRLSTSRAERAWEDVSHLAGDLKRFLQEGSELG